VEGRPKQETGLPRRVEGRLPRDRGVLISG
jgi:hypothetical protein